MTFGKIGARRMMWKNPYVTDGLVAFYDGTWNAGPNIHSATITAPVNLVTLEPATSHSGGLAFDHNSIALSNSNNGYVSQDIPIGDSDFTIDILLKSTSSNDSVFCELTRQDGRWLKCESYRSEAIGWGVGGAFFPTNNTGGIDVIQQKVCVVNRGVNLSLYTNGIFSMNYTHTGNVGVSPIIIGREIIGTHTQPNGNIYRILVYKGAKVASEIAANYAVDKARFNLP